MATTSDGRFGPNTPLVTAFLSCLGRLPFAELGRAVAGWRALVTRPGTAWHRAEDCVAEALAESGRYAEQRHALEALYDVFRRASWFNERAPGTSIPGSDASAQYVTTAALFALLVRDVLDPSDFDAMYAPFADVVPVDALAAPEVAGGGR
jgi:hypothetical protein